MTATATLAVSRRLYELSGWKPYGHLHIEAPDVSVPAYDLGYLLRKLQDLDDLTLLRCHHIDSSRNWEAECETDENRYFAYADTPEDATCLLVIKLFEAGMLEKSV